MAKKKATKAGRPPLPAEERRESFISVRLTTEQRELIDRAAEAIGQQPGVLLARCHPAGRPAGSRAGRVAVRVGTNDTAVVFGRGQVGVQVGHLPIAGRLQGRHLYL